MPKWWEIREVTGRKPDRTPTHGKASGRFAYRTDAIDAAIERRATVDVYESTGGDGSVIVARVHPDGGVDFR